MVSGVLLFLTLLRKVSCRFCARSAAIVVVPFFARGPHPASLIARPLCPAFLRSVHEDLGGTITRHVGARCKHKLVARRWNRAKLPVLGPFGMVMEIAS